MALRIKTNVMSLTAQRHLDNSSRGVNRHMEQLTSGMRINKAADDAAGLAISEVIRSDLRSLNQSRRNTNDGISLIQVAEGSLVEVGNIVIRLKELAVQAASDTIGTRERGYLNLEYMQLKDEIDRITLSTEFNGTRLLTGMSELPESIRVKHQYPPFEIQVDKDYSEDIDALTIPNPTNIIRLDFQPINTLTGGEGSLEIGPVGSDNETKIDVKEDAQRSMSALDKAVRKVASYRALLGSWQNRLESADRNLGIRMENLAAARSRIADADFASQTAQFTQFSIMQQAGAAVQLQANQLPEIALQLLKG